MTSLCEQERLLRLLLEHLDNTDPRDTGSWHGWQVTLLDGGRNNRLFRVRHSIGDFVAKFTIRDDRNRAHREFQALLAMKEAALAIAPMPILVDTTTYRQPVVIQTWIAGDRIDTPPSTDDQWQEFLQHLLMIRTITPETSSVQLSKAYNASTVEEGRSLVHQQLAQIPHEAQPGSLQDWVRQFERTTFAEWEQPPLTLCRADPKLSNFIRCANGMTSVDWEYSGWGDPAFEIADMMAHPDYFGVPSSRWEWVSQVYARRISDSGCEHRVRTYFRILVVWWLARFSRYSFQMSRGVDHRLAPQPVNWREDTQEKYSHYLKLAESLYD